MYLMAPTPGSDTTPPDNGYYKICVDERQHKSPHLGDAVKRPDSARGGRSDRVGFGSGGAIPGPYGTNPWPWRASGGVGPGRDRFSSGSYPTMVGYITWAPTRHAVLDGTALGHRRGQPYGQCCVKNKSTASRSTSSVSSSLEVVFASFKVPIQWAKLRSKSVAAAVPGPNVRRPWLLAAHPASSWVTF